MGLGLRAEMSNWQHRRDWATLLASFHFPQINQDYPQASLSKMYKLSGRKSMKLQKVVGDRKSKIQKTSRKQKFFISLLTE